MGEPKSDSADAVIDEMVNLLQMMNFQNDCKTIPGCKALLKIRRDVVSALAQLCSREDLPKQTKEALQGLYWSTGPIVAVGVQLLALKDFREPFDSTKIDPMIKIASSKRNEAVKTLEKIRDGLSANC